MVEFALALPLLLLLIFGILEVGRMVFTYSSVVNASREAVRYGSATGLASGASRAS
jgi:Flp pilus assembly protein TadG